MKVKTADIQFVTRDNADQLNIGKTFVGNNTLVFFRLTNCTKEDLKDILNFKSWVFHSWKEGTVKRFFVHHWESIPDGEIVWCMAGFSSILIRYLQNSKGFTIYGKETYRAKNLSIPIPDMKFKLWDFQKDAVKHWIDAGCYGIIKCPTAAGKSIIASNIIKRMNTRTIILVHTSDLLINVWFNYLVEQFGEGIKPRIGIVGGGLTKKDRNLMHIISESFQDNIKKDIVIATSQSLLNNLYELGKEKWGLMIVDEVHRYPAEQFKKVVNVISTPYKLGLSATLERTDGRSPMMKGLIGNIVYSITIRELVSKGLLVEPIFYSMIINDEDSQLQISNCNLKLLDYARYIKKVSASSEMKFRYIVDLCTKLKAEGRKFMCYTDFVTENNELDENNIITKGVFIRDNYVKALSKRGLKVLPVTADLNAVGRQSIFNRLNKGELDGLIFGSLGNEGINIPIVDTIIMCNATASTIRYPQRCGRAMRRYEGKKNCYIYEVLLNTRKELQWSKDNFLEYEQEKFTKKIIYINRARKQ